MKFKGTIIITDPCYFVKDKDWTEEVYAGDGDLTHLGFTNSLCSSTIYGDWTCSIYEKDSDTLKEDIQELFEEYDWRGLNRFEKESKKIGEFCSDAGLVSVILLEDLEKYNPNIIPFLKPNMATIIENYEGDVEICTFLDRHVVIIGENFYTLQN